MHRKFHCVCLFVCVCVCSVYGRVFHYVVTVILRDCIDCP